jgi:hypothetical protein
MALASRKIFINSQERQPGWVNSKTRVIICLVDGFVPSLRDLVPSSATPALKRWAELFPPSLDSLNNG